MRGASLIGHVREVLEEILARPAVPADGTISGFFRDRRYLGSRDRGFIADAAYATLRNILRYRFLLFDSFDTPIVPEDSGAYLALYLLERDEHPEYRDIEEGGDLNRDDVHELRDRIEGGKKRIASLGEPERSAVRYGVPVWFAEAVRRERPDDSDALLASLNEQGPITVRANTLLTTPENLAESFEAQGIASRPGEYVAEALYLLRRLNANALPEFKQGWFELQDEGSQLLSHVLDPHPGWKVFDACAGAGGKSLHLAALMKGRGEIVAHDVNVRRLENLRPRLKRSGAQNVRIMLPNEFRENRESLLGKYDAVLIDAPCSGTGTLRRNPGSLLTLAEDMVERVARLQREILADYSALVKPGGILMYATCSLLRAENEEQVKRFLEESGEWSTRIPTTPEGMLTGDGFFRCYPHLHGTDGFFGAVLRRES